MDDIATRLRRFARAVAWRRRLLAAGLAAAAVALAIEAASPAPPETRDVVVAARDLTGGTALAADHLTTRAVPPGAVPEGHVTADAVLGEVLAGPVRAGEMLTDVRLVGESMLAGWGEELVAAPVRIADAAAAELLRPGDRIDVLATSTDGSLASAVVASSVPVLTITHSTEVLADGTLVVVATTAEQAARLADAAVTSRITFTLVADRATT